MTAISLLIICCMLGPFTPTTPISKESKPKCLNILIENTENMIIITHLGHIKINDNFVLAAWVYLISNHFLQHLCTRTCMLHSMNKEKLILEWKKTWDFFISTYCALGTNLSLGDQEYKIYITLKKKKEKRKHSRN